MRRKDKIADKKTMTQSIIDSAKQPAEKKVFSKKLLHSGSVMLNLACTDSLDGAWGIGRMVNLIGDSSAGKTLLALSMLAEASINPEFAEHDLIYDDAESALSFDLSGMFGSKFSERIKAPNYDGEGVAIHSDTIQDFFYTCKRLLKAGKPFIYVLDSFDSISSVDEAKKIEDNYQAHEKGKDEKGSYGDGKAKVSSQIFRSIIRDLDRNNSFLLIISQTRENLNAMNPFDKKTRSGGKALKFYATHEIWLALKGAIKSKDRKVGAYVRAKITKNKITGKLREVDFPIYYDYGVDDIGAMIDFMVEEKQWGKSGNSIVIPAIDFKGTEDKLIKLIESDKKIESKIRRMVQKTWNDIEESLQLGRKKKYEW